MRLVAILALIGAMATPASAQDVISPAEFRDDVIGLLKAARADICVVVVDDWTLHFGTNEAECGNTLNIDNMYREYLGTPSQRAELQSKLAATGLGMLAERDLSDFESRLVVVLRPAEYAVLGDGEPAVHRPFAGDLIALLMLDSATTLSTLDAGTLSDHDLSEDQAFAQARRNLPDRMGDVVVEVIEGITVIGAESGLATGLMWLPDSCDAVSEGRRAHILDRNTYFQVDGRDAVAAGRFAEISAGLIANDAALSRTVLVCESGAWVTSD